MVLIHWIYYINPLIGLLFPWVYNINHGKPWSIIVIHGQPWSSMVECCIVKMTVSIWKSTMVNHGPMSHCGKGCLDMKLYCDKGCLDIGPDLWRNATKYTCNHKYKDAVEITLHFINIKELKFAYRQNGNKIARALVAYLWKRCGCYKPLKCVTMKLEGLFII